jgi:hypothetical protein
MQATEDIWKLKNQRLELAKTKLSDSRSQVAENVCTGKSRPQRGEVARSPHVYVHKMRDEVYLLDQLQVSTSSPPFLGLG